MTIKLGTFAAQFKAAHAVIDTNHLSADLTKKLGDLGLSAADLKKVAGADGQIKSDSDFKKLFALVDGFDGKTDKQATLFDGAKALTPAGQLNQALLDEVKTNRGIAQYVKPGSKPASEQPSLQVVANALTVDVKDQKKPVALPVKGISQFDYADKNGLDGNKACFATAVAQAEQYVASAFGKNAPKLGMPDDAIQMAYAEDTEGRVVGDPTQLKLGLAYIDKSLDAGYPVVAGASYADDAYNNDKLTDHFVTIHKRGYDGDGRLFYEFKDPGAGGRTGRLYVDKDTGKLFKEGDHKQNYVENADYQLTQVRTWNGLE